MLDPFAPYLLKRWQDGCRNALQLYREIKQQGYPGGQGTVLRWARRRREKPAPSTPGRYLSQVAERCRAQSISRLWGTGKPSSPRRAVWLFLARPDSLDAEEKPFLEQMTGCSLETAKAYQLAQRFREMARRKGSEDFGQWMEDALQSGLPDFESFAAGLGREWEAVEAALKKPWSNGQVEGHISRLKFLKRQMYGRASFELLRRRVLNAA
jgi:transposase